MTVTVDLQIAFDSELPDVEQIQQWAESALSEVGEDCELSIRLVGEQESADLNSTYRGKMGPTNVLSFPFDSPVPIEPRLLGDLLICVPVVETEAKQQNKAASDHWAHMVVHGCLHLLGYDHIETKEAEQMEALEVTILQSLKIGNPYAISEQGESK
jgi:probable rRNA maturation factor